MNINKTLLSAAVGTALGTAGMAVSTVASAVGLLDAGHYELIINATPTGTRTTYYNATETFFKIGSEARGYNTSFTFGAAPNALSQGTLDNDTVVNVTNDWSGFYPGNGPGGFGTAALGDGAGRLTFDVDADGNIHDAASFQLDTIAGTAGGNFAQYINGGVNSGSYVGSIDAAGVFNLNIANRFGAIDGPAGGVVAPWNIEPGGSTFVDLSSSDPSGLTDPGTGAITGTDCTGTAGAYECVLVSYGEVGAAWGTFEGNPYYETWDISLNRLGDELVTASAIPVPAAAWLFGSGLLGLVGVARRRKTS